MQILNIPQDLFHSRGEPLDEPYHSRAVHALEEHTAIYEALAAHDGDRAAEASLRHVENARANLADIIQKEG